MKSFKYENTVFQRALLILLIIIINCVCVWYYDAFKWQYYAIMLPLCIICMLFFDMLSYKNLFVKTGSYRVEGMSIYLKKSKNEVEIPMDMVDDICANRTSFLFCKYDLKIKMGVKTYTISSESLSKECDFTDTSLAPIVDVIIFNNSQLELLPSVSNSKSYIWKYKKD